MNIKILRVQNCMTYDEFAEQIGVSSRTLRRWECGERDPSVKNLKKIVDTYRIDDLYSFMYGDTKPKEIPQLVYLN